MKLQCYALSDFAPKLVPARPQRQWMDDFADRHPYRCLPLSVANAHGWEVLCPVPIEITWNGGPTVEDISIRALKPLPGGRPVEHFCKSNFSRGIVTFHLDYIFRTEPGWNLLATGSFNSPKDLMNPLTGIMESEWLPYPFTMNWQLMRPGRKFFFDEDEPICFVLPVQTQGLVDCEPEIFRISDDPELQRQHEAFRTSRDEFMKRFRAGDPAALKQPWLRYYFVGKHPDGTQANNHVNKLRLKEPIDRRTPSISVAAPATSQPTLSGAVLGGLTPPVAIHVPEGSAGTYALATTPVTIQLTEGSAGSYALPPTAVLLTTQPEPVVKAVEKPVARPLPTDPRWQDDSSLNAMPHAQSKLNEQGRKRIDREGRVADTSRTRFIRSAKDAAGLDLLVVDDLLTAEECQTLCQTFHELGERIFKDDTIDPFWNNRFIWFADVLELRPAAGNLMAEKQRRALDLVRQFYRLKTPVYADLLQIVCWKPGMFMPPHADNANPDGSKHMMAHRELSGVIYLNDDYDGGELYFTGLDLAIKPKRGMLVAMSGGFHHEHAVLRVDKGPRFTMPSFFTFDRSKADKSIFDQEIA